MASRAHQVCQLAMVLAVAASTRRLLRLYRDAEVSAAKGLAVAVLGDLLVEPSADSPEIVALLSSIARAEWRPGEATPESAIHALLCAGPRGVPALRALHERTAVSDEGVRALLTQLSQRGFRMDSHAPRR